MGLAIDRERFEEAEFPPFVERLERSLVALRELVERPGFGEGPGSLGAEIELSLVDERGDPLPRNRTVLGESTDPRLTVELDRFNMECNLRPTPLAGRPLAALATEIDDAVGEVRRAAALHDGRIAVIGILPTLTPAHLQSTAMTDFPRYRALSWAIQRLRREPFHLCIDGEDPLEMTCDEITFEGAATSLQVHLRVAPSRFADVYNAVQLATGPTLALAGNSPTFLGHRLWHETRIALFKQAVDDRGSHSRHEGVARVSFGSGWVREGALELFAENVAIHEPLLPVLSEEDPLDCVRAGGVPLLEEMRLHQGTVWRWNRAIYDPVEGGHLRIEMRSLPAGPTTPDMVANAAFQIGLALGLAPEAERWTREMPFAAADYNFYRAAQSGIDAELLWPRDGAGPQPRPARELVLELLPCARDGLVGAGVEGDDADRFLDVIARRAERGQTGASWQRATLAALGHERPERFAALLERYLALVAGGDPVHDWPVED